MPEDKYKGHPVRIESDEILDPVTRWVCQRLDRIVKNQENAYKVFTEMLIELRTMNQRLEDMRDAVNDGVVVNRDKQRYTEEVSEAEYEQTRDD